MKNRGELKKMLEESVNLVKTKVFVVARLGNGSIDVFWIFILRKLAVIEFHVKVNVTLMDFNLLALKRHFFNQIRILLRFVYRYLETNTESVFDAKIAVSSANAASMLRWETPKYSYNIINVFASLNNRKVSVWQIIFK